MLVPMSFQQKNAAKKINLIASYFTKPETVLDFGCGDLSFAKALKNEKNFLKITGVDVVDFHNRDKNVTFIHYDGERIPCKDKSFDTVISYFVLHHTNDARKYFQEILRVAKKRIILVESVARTPIDFPGMKFMDWLFNVWKPEPIPLTYQFLSKKEWYEIFKQNNLRLQSEIDAEIMPIPNFFPTGRSTLFELIKD